MAKQLTNSEQIALLISTVEHQANELNLIKEQNNQLALSLDYLMDQYEMTWAHVSHLGLTTEEGLKIVHPPVPGASAAAKAKVIAKNMRMEVCKNFDEMNARMRTLAGKGKAQKQSDGTWVISLG